VTSIDKVATESTRRGLGEFGGKVAIVTGGGAGIGYAIARAFAREGAHVAIAGRTKETLTRSAEAIERECGAPVLAVAADVAEPTDCEGMIAETVRRFGAIDMLVNNAALFSVVPLIDADAAEASRFFAVNAIGPLNVARAFARWAIDHGRGGAIVNISSIAAGRPALNVGLYSASKAALDSLTRSMAVEWAASGIQANAIGPGYMLTDMNQALMDNQDFNAWLMSRIPSKRWGRPDELVGAAIFLASSASDYVNGQIIYVDGGMLAAM